MAISFCATICVVAFFNTLLVPQPAKYWAFALAVIKIIVNFAANFNIMCFLVPFLYEMAHENARRTFLS